MKFVAVLISIWLAQCQTTDSQHTKKTPRHHRTQPVIIPTQPRATAAIISSDRTGTLVSEDWMRRYKLLESKHGAIPEDAMIWKEGELYRISFKVGDHFNEMVRKMK